MATASTRAASIKTPGVQTPETPETNEGPAFAPGDGDSGTGSTELDASDTAPTFEMPADLAAFIKAEIAKGVAAGMAALRPAAAAPSAQAELPSQAEAMKQVKSGGRAVLSTAGYVCPLPEDVAVQRDANGFAKS
ncbi:hypothetical protein [Comamonas sp. F1-6]|uniref:hypothetical protein n=1 Tax=Comamonas sp. F1-6 TaxID=673550 RepID=UPI0031CE920A